MSLALCTVINIQKSNFGFRDLLYKLELNLNKNYLYYLSQ